MDTLSEAEIAVSARNFSAARSHSSGRFYLQMSSAQYDTVALQIQIASGNHAFPIGL